MRRYARGMVMASPPVKHRSNGTYRPKTALKARKVTLGLAIADEIFQTMGAVPAHAAIGATGVLTRTSADG